MIMPTKTFTSLEKAYKYGKEIARQTRDFQTSTRKIRFEANGQLLVSTGTRSKAVPVTPIAMSHLCKLFNVPTAFSKVKGTMNDLTHLAETFNRHGSKLQGQGILVRRWVGKDPCIRAVFPDNYALLDLPEAIQAMRIKLEKRVREWPWIVVSGFALRACALFARKGEHSDSAKGFYPAILVSCSDDGSVPIGCEIGIFRYICTNMQATQHPDFPGFRLRRKEKTEGGFNTRFRNCLEQIRKNALPAFKAHLRDIKELRSMKLGDNRLNVLHLGTRYLFYPKKVCDGVLAAWPKTTNTLMDVWNAITRVADIHTQAGRLDQGYVLQAAAGHLLHSSPMVRDILVTASYKGDK